jgi:hypothetical protein
LAGALDGGPIESFASANKTSSARVSKPQLAQDAGAVHVDGAAGGKELLARVGRAGAVIRALNGRRYNATASKGLRRRLLVLMGAT